MSRRRVSGVGAGKVDTRQALMMGDFGNETGIDLAIRREERIAILAYWPAELLEQIVGQVYVAPPWRLLQRPTTWDEDQAIVVGFVTDFLAERRHWPRLGDLMRHLGRVSNHRTAVEAEGQGELF